MKSPATEWIAKAEGDYHAAGVLFRARKYPNYDAACFHAEVIRAQLSAHLGFRPAGKKRNPRVRRTRKRTR